MEIATLKARLAETIQSYHRKGWSPATSGNYSFLDKAGTIWVSKSGLDKSRFAADDFMTVNNDGIAIGDFKYLRPSAETLIHCAIYELYPETRVILHSHSVNAVVLSSLENKTIQFSGYEIQKGFFGQTDHEKTLEIPIFENTQDMASFRDMMRAEAARIKHHAFIIQKHGSYAWGSNLLEAKRHLETLEFLCECSLKLKSCI